MFKFMEEEKEKALKRAYKACFSGEEGKLVLRDLFSVCGVRGAACVPLTEKVGCDPIWVGKLCGRQEIGLYLLGMVGVFDAFEEDGSDEAGD